MSDALQRIADLEYTAVEIAIADDSNHITAADIYRDRNEAHAILRKSHRLEVTSFHIEIGAVGDEHYQQFEAICELARISKVVTLNVPSAELGTPFNEEVEHLRRLVGIADDYGAKVCIRNQSGRQASDPDTIKVLCDNVDNLGLAFDPSIYICGPDAGKDTDKIQPYVGHVYLRDTSSSEFQVKVGQGEVDYAKVISQLNAVGYRRALCVDVVEMPGVEHSAEMRKMRLLVESLL
ncbi:MAG: TIM barrel protein [Planctomycetota bacterium]|nr:TIM barrel protein [Planctomycetota bacterium]